MPMSSPNAVQSRSCTPDGDARPNQQPPLFCGAGNAQQALGLGATKLPAWVWGYLPPRTALALRTAARSYTESRLLPVIAVGGISGSPLLSRGSHRGGKGGLGSPGLGPGGGISGGVASGVSGIAGSGGSGDSLDSPKLRHYGSPRRPSGQLQTAASGGLSSLSRTQEPFLHVPLPGQPVAAAPVALGP